MQVNADISTCVKKFGSSDHLPVLTCLKTKISRKKYKRTIVKRKMKNFNNALWNKALAKRNWDEIASTDNLDKKFNKGPLVLGFGFWNF